MFLIPSAVLIDILFGDPRNRYHLVAYVGKVISLAERNFNKGKNRRFNGLIMTSALFLSSFYFINIVIFKTAERSKTLAVVISIFIIWQSISYKTMVAIAQKINNALERKDITRARFLVSQIVGRDTNELGEAEISRATVESISENAVDSFVAPIFFAFIGGAPLAFAYRVANTMDAMVGYKNEKYSDFGWASAKLDDVLNFIPARITVLITMIAAFVNGENWRKVVRSAVEFSGIHASPNSGIVEAAAAGALSLRLGGPSSYGDKQVFYGYLGDGEAPSAKDINRSARLLRTTVIITIVFFLTFNLVSQIWF